MKEHNMTRILLHYHIMCCTLFKKKKKREPFHAHHKSHYFLHNSIVKVHYNSIHSQLAEAPKYYFKAMTALWANLRLIQTPTVSLNKPSGVPSLHNTTYLGAGVLNWRFLSTPEVDCNSRAT